MANRYASTYRGFDYLQLDNQLTEEQKLIRETIRNWVNTAIIPTIENNAEHNHFPKHIIKELGKIGALGPHIPTKYGGGGLDAISYGIIMQELERADSGIRSCASVQSSLVMYPIWKFGSEIQKKKYLPLLAQGDLVGSFGLTEPNHGSDPGSMETRLIKKEDKYILSGAKLWITNAPICDIAVVWAKNEQNHIVGCMVERGMKGFSTNEITGKWSLRASITGELIFDDVALSEEYILPEAKGLKAPLSCLSSARYGIAWAA